MANKKQKCNDNSIVLILLFLSEFFKVITLMLLWHKFSLMNDFIQLINILLK